MRGAAHDRERSDRGPEGRSAAPEPAAAPDVAHILALQRAAGNQAVARTLAGGGAGAVLMRNDSTGGTATTASPGTTSTAAASGTTAGASPPAADPAQRQRAEQMLIEVCAEAGVTHMVPTDLIYPFEREEGVPTGEQMTHLPPEYIRARLADRANNAELNRVFDESVGRIVQRWQDFRSENRMDVLYEGGRIVRLLMRQFIHDPNASSLDLLGPQLSQRYRGTRWGNDDYPGGPAGGNEALARRMVRDLIAIRPERRANSTVDAVLDGRQYAALRGMDRFVVHKLVNVPGTNGHRLHADAADAFVQMREAAAADVDPQTGQGVELAPAGGPGSFYRTPAQSARAAARVQNPAAVAAGLSSHNLGLAVDLRMSAGRQRYTETSTRMPNAVAMRQSPAHKWLFVRGATFGFYPYMNEPWHWEYNPPGFREKFMREYQEWLAQQPGGGGAGQGAGGG